MFTGIVEELGTIAEVTDQGDAVRLTVAAAAVLEGTVLASTVSRMASPWSVTSATVPSSSTIPANI